MWSKNNLPGGRYVLSIKGKDTVDNVGRPASHTWIVGKYFTLVIYYFRIKLMLKIGCKAVFCK